MSLLTLCFSWYSLMSIRVNAPSSLNKYWANAFANSVLPTPVVPKNKKLPMGLLGSPKPARERRMASLTLFMAAFWPITRLCSCSSMRNSFMRSLSSIFCTGMPVQRLTTSAISSAVTSSLIMVRSLRSMASSADSNSFSASCIKPYRISATRP